MNKILKISIIGFVISILSLLIEWQYCMGGMAHGFPIPAIHPSHEDEIFFIYLAEKSKTHTPVLDFMNLALNTLAWVLIANILYFSRQFIQGKFKKKGCPD